MIKRIAILTATLSATVCCCFTTAAQVHQHGQGQLFISQESSDWHVQFILPAADVLGFEHAPENAQQEKTLHSLIERLNNNDAIVDLSEHCTLSEVTHSLGEHSLLEHSSFEAHEHENGGNGGHHDDEYSEPSAHKEPSVGKEPSAHEKLLAHKNHTEHNDVEVEYHFTCDASNKTLSVALFQWLPSLSRIQAQWITDAGQGTATLTPASPDLEW